MIIKALSIKPPWINLIVHGLRKPFGEWPAGFHKTIETRFWKTHHREALLLVSSKTVDRNCGFYFAGGKTHPVPPGHAIGVCTLVDCVRMKEHHEKDAMSDCLPGLWAWMLEAVRPIEPFPVRGMPGLFDVEIDEGVIGS